MSGDEEEDYMSDAFLSRCLPKDVRPGLKRSHPLQREHALQKKKAEEAEEAAKRSKKSGRELEEEKRQEGLRTSLDETNKGFAMLQKMGYKTGESLGKSNSGRVEPVPVQVKANRGGLGRDAVLKEIAEEKRVLREKKLARSKSNVDADEYRAHLSRQRRWNLVLSDLRKSQKVCQSLDVAKDPEAGPADVWFWPERIPAAAARVEGEEEYAEEEVEEEEEEECEFEPDEQLVILTCYLRKEHFYCLWCGNSFSDAADLSDNCPGRSRDDHDD